MTVKCPKCQADNSETKQFCGDCGTQLPLSKDIRPEVTETLKTPVKELTTGSTFAGRYQVIEELGRGGMGKVYKVYDTRIKEKVALKLIKPDVAADRETIERFNNELRLARKVRHKNVCGMFDLGEAEGSYFITMEYVHGEDLKSMIRMSTGLTVGTVVSVGKQVCDGLAEAHSLGVVHRDLKPQNIMIDKGGNAKIMDFGIARSIKEKGITGPSVLIGTPEYMSSEQAEAKEVDQRSDIYSLGIILYEMATGRVPFEGETALSIAMKHKGEMPKSPRQLNPNIPDDLSGVILKCLEKEKSKRYQQAGDVREDLERIEKGLPTTERMAPERKPFTSREITVKFQPKKLLIPALAIVAVIVAAIVFWPKKASNLDPDLVAVAVFENKTGDPKLDPIGSMAAERIMQGLAQVGGFSLAPMPPAGALAVEATNRDKLRALAEVTKAGKIVYGDYFLQSGNLLFHAWVQDMAAKKNIVPLEPASGPLSDPAAALEPLRLRLMGGLACVFDPMLKSFFLLMKEPPNLEAYREFVEAVRFFLRSDYTNAIEHGLRAAEYDPKLRMVLICAAVAYCNQGQNAKADELAKELAKSRAELSAGERSNLDWLEAHLRGDNEAKLRAVRQLAGLVGTLWNYQNALDANRCNFPREAVAALAKYDPYDPAWKDWSRNYWGVLTTAHHMLGNHKQELKEARRGRKQFPERLGMLANEVDALAALGRTDELQNLFEESKALPPSTGGVMLAAGRELRAHGFREESVRVLNQALQWFGGRPEQEKATAAYRHNRARTLYVLEKWEEAKTIFMELHTDVPDNINYLGYLGAVAARKGEKEESLTISKELEEDQRPYLFGNPTYWRARIAALLGDKEGAVNLLRQATKQGYAYSGLHPCEDFESLADHSPYIQFIKLKG